jgi:hypothetical protein
MAGWFSTSADVCALLTTALSGYIAFVTWRRRTAAARSAVKVEGYKQSFEHFATTKPANACILSVMLLPAYASADHEIRDFYHSIKSRAPRHQVNIRMEGINTLPDDIEHFLNELRRARAEIDAVEVSEVHLFFAGPLAAALLAGAALDHWKLVKLHHKHHQTKRYEYWGTLQK